MPDPAHGKPAALIARNVSRPEAVGSRQAVVTGHPLATLAAMRVLDAGGNAIDAGVAAGLAIAVLQPDVVQTAGVAPIMIYRADSREVKTISGLGRWPRKVSIEFFEKHTGGKLPLGILRSVVPAGIDAWTTALEQFGTKGFSDVAMAAVELAEHGFAVHRLMHEVVCEKVANYAGWPSSARVFLRDGRAPEIGSRFVQKDLARSLRRLMEAEIKSSGGRVAGLQAVRDAFYRGPIAAEIDRYYREAGGLLTAEDLRDFRVKVEPPTSVSYRGYQFYGCGPWCQGPMLLEFLNLVEKADLEGLGHNSVDYIHYVTEAMKLGFADREAYFGDPEFVDVPVDLLTSKPYAEERRRQISPDRAWPEMPPPGGLGPRMPAGTNGTARSHASADSHLDTTYLCIVDRDGNAFSATPSDGSYNAPLVPGLGFAVSPRGSQSWLVRGHPSAVEPWKRPRLTPNPAMVLKDGALLMVLGSPGGDVQCQAMLQVFLNVVTFGKPLQEAIDAPRFTSASFPSSFYPHESHPGRLILDSELAIHADSLTQKGHRIEHWPYRHWRGGGVCAIVADRARGFLVAGGDPRRECYALAW